MFTAHRMRWTENICLRFRLAKGSDNFCSNENRLYIRRKFTINLKKKTVTKRNFNSHENRRPCNILDTN